MNTTKLTITYQTTAYIKTHLDYLLLLQSFGHKLRSFTVEINKDEIREAIEDLEIDHKGEPLLVFLFDVLEQVSKETINIVFKL